MTNLIIIGNGFDMAHNLETSYSKFIEFLVNSKFKNQTLYSDLFELDEITKIKYENYAEFKDNQNSYLRESLFITDNLFFKKITTKLFESNWCDIEREYFIELSNIGKDASYETAKELNIDFEIVKKHLSDYLKNEQSNFEQVWAYEQYFEKMSLKKR